MQMIQVMILGQELKADLLNPKVAEQYEKGMAAAINEIQEARNCDTGKEGMEMQCNAVIKYLDNTFGKGSARKVLGDSTDLLTCLDALEEMVDLYEKQINPIIVEKSKRIGEKLKGNIQLKPSEIE